MNLGVYFHLPYCIHRCVYCDFVVAELKKKTWLSTYISLLKKEIHQCAKRGDFQGRTIDTIYFGGGTPSLFTPEQIQDLIETLSSVSSLIQNSEVTMEVNPCSVTYSKLKGYADARVNRLSFGVQTFNATHLKTLERVHSKEQSVEAISNAIKCGLNNFNLDFIFGIPNQTLEDVRADIKQAIELNVPHLSTYALTIDATNPLFPHLPKDERATDMYEWISRALMDANYCHYETSAFAKKGSESQHNLKYWLLEDYLGLGVGAFSYMRSEPHPWGKHWNNEEDLTQYEIRISRDGEAIAEEEVLTRDKAKKDFLLTRLRLLDKGLDENEFENRFHESLIKSYACEIDRLDAKGFLDSRQNVLKLSSKGKLFLNQVLLEFM